MQKFARVQNGEVVEILIVNPGEPLPRDRFHPELAETFIKVTGNVADKIQPGWLYDGNSFYLKPPPNPTPPDQEDSDAVEEIPPNVFTVPLYRLRNRLQERNFWNKFVDELKTRPEILINILFSRGYVRSDNRQLRNMLEAIGANPNQILRKENSGRNQ